MDQCIFCDQNHTDTTVEHIVPSSLGNVHYILPKGTVCSKCNNRFSKYENKVLSSRQVLSQRYPKKDHSDAPDLKRSALVPFLLKIGFESLFKSRYAIWKQPDFVLLKHKLVYGSTDEWNLYRGVTRRSKLLPVPGFIDRIRLSASGIRLDFSYDAAAQSLLFVFMYRRMVAAIDLLSPEGQDARR